jgi:hypothetical protein
MHVDTKELVIAAATGTVFGLLGYYFTRRIHGWLGGT